LTLLKRHPTQNTMTQTEEILNWLKDGNRITALEALDMFGCFRLGARIYDIKRMGYDIESRPFRTSGGATISEYRLKQPPKPIQQTLPI
jgi:hypothetical protein